jgi:flagellar hook-length control protein FliK
LRPAVPVMMTADKPHPIAASPVPAPAEVIPQMTSPPTTPAPIAARPAIKSQPIDALQDNRTTPAVPVGVPASDAMSPFVSQDTPPVSPANASALHPTTSPNAIRVTTLPSAIPVMALPETIAVLARTNSHQKVEIRLDPIELGAVQVTMQGTDKDIAVVIMVERADTLDLLRKHADQFLADLRQSGYSGTSLTFNLADQHGAAPRQPMRPPPTELEPLPPPPQPPRPTSRTSGLDMRL